jgi:hypothetical protein
MRKAFDYGPTNGQVRSNCNFRSVLDDSEYGTWVGNTTDDPMLMGERHQDSTRNIADTSLPYLEKAFEFRPRAGSPLRQAGTNGGGAYDLASIDFVGTPVNQSTPSIGPFEVATDVKINVVFERTLSDLPARYDHAEADLYSHWAKGFLGRTSPDLYGVNLPAFSNWLGYLSGEWNTANNAEDTDDIIDHIDELFDMLVNDVGVTSIRYPAGLPSNKWNMLHSIGPLPRATESMVGRDGVSTVDFVICPPGETHCSAACQEDSYGIFGLDEFGFLLEKYNVTGLMTLPFSVVDDNPIARWCDQAGLLVDNWQWVLLALSNNFLWNYTNHLDAAGMVTRYMCQEYSTSDFEKWRGLIGWSKEYPDGHRGPYVLNESVYPYTLGAIRFFQLGNERWEGCGIDEGCPGTPASCPSGDCNNVSSFRLDDVAEEMGGQIESDMEGTVCDGGDIMIQSSFDCIVQRTDDRGMGGLDNCIEEAAIMDSVGQHWTMDTRHPYLGLVEDICNGFSLPTYGDEIATYVSAPSDDHYDFYFFGSGSNSILNLQSKLEVFIDDESIGITQFDQSTDCVDPISPATAYLSRGLHKMTIKNVSTQGSSPAAIAINYFVDMYRVSDNAHQWIDFRVAPSTWDMTTAATYTIEDVCYGLQTAHTVPNASGAYQRRIGYTEFSHGYGDYPGFCGRQSTTMGFLTVADELRACAKWNIATTDIWVTTLAQYALIEGSDTDQLYRRKRKPYTRELVDPYQRRITEKGIGFSIVAKNIRGRVINSYVVNGPIEFMDIADDPQTYGTTPRWPGPVDYITSIAASSDDSHLNILIINKHHDEQTIDLNITGFTTSSYQIIKASTIGADASNRTEDCYAGYFDGDDYKSCISYEEGSSVGGSPPSSITVEPTTVVVIKCTGS